MPITSASSDSLFHAPDTALLSHALCHPEHSVSDFGFHDCRWQSYLRKMRSSFDSLSLLRRTAFLKCLNLCSKRSICRFVYKSHKVFHWTKFLWKVDNFSVHFVSLRNIIIHGRVRSFLLCVLFCSDSIIPSNRANFFLFCFVFLAWWLCCLWITLKVRYIET